MKYLIILISVIGFFCSCKSYSKLSTTEHLTITRKSYSKVLGKNPEFAYQIEIAKMSIDSVERKIIDSLVIKQSTAEIDKLVTATVANLVSDQSICYNGAIKFNMRRKKLENTKDAVNYTLTGVVIVSGIISGVGAGIAAPVLIYISSAVTVVNGTATMILIPINSKKTRNCDSTVVRFSKYLERIDSTLLPSKYFIATNASNEEKFNWVKKADILHNKFNAYLTEVTIPVDKKKISKKKS